MCAAYYHLVRDDPEQAVVSGRQSGGFDGPGMGEVIAMEVGPLLHAPLMTWEAVGSPLAHCLLPLLLQICGPGNKNHL